MPQHLFKPHWHIIQHKQRIRSQQHFPFLVEKGAEEAEGTGCHKPDVVCLLFREFKLKKMGYSDDLFKEALKFRPVKTKKSRMEKENID